VKNTICITRTVALWDIVYYIGINLVSLFELEWMLTVKTSLFVDTVSSSGQWLGYSYSGWSSRWSYYWPTLTAMSACWKASYWWLQQRRLDGLYRTLSWRVSAAVSSISGAQYVFVWSHLGRDVTMFEFDDVRILATSGVFDIRRIVWSFSVECKQSKNFPFIAQNGNCVQLVLGRSFQMQCNATCLLTVETVSICVDVITKRHRNIFENSKIIDVW